jgi:hypothetical protein
MALDYRERSTLGTGWALEVCLSGVPVGHIQFGAHNLFKYYEGAPTTSLTPLLSDADLEALRRKVEDYYRGAVTDSSAIGERG